MSISRTPHEPVDAFAGEVSDPERARRRVRLLFLAAFVFAALAWVGTLVTATVSSERNGIVASWIAIFPTTFGAGGLLATSQGTAAGKAIAIALAAGVLGSAALWLFFEAIWPAL